VLTNDAPLRGVSVQQRRARLSAGTLALKNAVELTNRYIANTHRQTSMFATVFFGLLDPVTGSLLYINAGQEPPLIIGPRGLKAHLNPTGPAIGLFPDLDFGIEQTEIEPGDTLLIFTDGVPDARNRRKEPFAEEGLLACLQPPLPSAPDVLDRIQAALRQHSGGIDQYDDITLLAAHRAA
jgi:sigma-B regulation protein RsbU (phosphoserine phosphatase)